jgi:hypothetical protein
MVTFTIFIWGYKHQYLYSHGIHTMSETLEQSLQHKMEEHTRTKVLIKSRRDAEYVLAKIDK